MEGKGRPWVSGGCCTVQVHKLSYYNLDTGNPSTTWLGQQSTASARACVLVHRQKPTRPRTWAILTLPLPSRT